MESLNYFLGVSVRDKQQRENNTAVMGRQTGHP